MNVRELKRRLLPYSGYMKPAEDGAGDGGGQAGAHDGSSTTEDRGDNFTPTEDPGDGGSVGNGGDAPVDSGAAEPEGGEGTEGRHAPAGIPKGRFDEVNTKRKEAEAKLAAAEEEIAKLRAAQAAAAPTDEGAKRSAPATAASPAAGPGAPFDVEAQEEAYVEALMEGKTKEAVAIRKAINAHLREEASASAKKELAEHQTVQLLKDTAESVAAAYPWLNQPEGADTLELILAARDRKIAAGMPPHLALAEAANTIAPKFAPAGDGGTPSRVSETGAPAKDLRPAAAIARGAADSTAQPPALQVGIGERATATRVNVAQMTEEQFEALTPAEKKRLRGD